MDVSFCYIYTGIASTLILLVHAAPARDALPALTLVRSSAPPALARGMACSYRILGIRSRIPSASAPPSRRRPVPMPSASSNTSAIRNGITNNRRLFVILRICTTPSAHLLEPPNSPDDSNKRLVHIHTLLGRRLDALGVEALGQIATFYDRVSFLSTFSSSKSRNALCQAHHEAAPDVRTLGRTCWRPQRRESNPCPSPSTLATSAIRHLHVAAHIAISKEEAKRTRKIC